MTDLLGYRVDLEPPKEILKPPLSPQASTQKSLEERNTAYAALAPKNRELTSKCAALEKAAEAAAECVYGPCC